jgi:probable HAF family extracellular repeat protein
MQDLGTLDGDGHSLGIGINDGGVITGISAAADFSKIRAFVWRGGVMTDLNQLIPATSALYLLTACSVNSRGEIIGFAVDPKGNLQGYLAAPVGAGEDYDATRVSPQEVSAEARSRVRSVGLGLAGRKVDR